MPFPTYCFSEMEQKISKLLELHEGRRRFPYKDTVDKLTIGVGFNLDDVGLYDNEIDFILKNRIELTIIQLERYLPFFNELDDVRKAVLIDMCYNMGPEPFDNDKIKDWPIFVRQVQDGDYVAAANNMRATKWAKQVKGRAERLSNMMETGQWPSDGTL